MIHEFSNPNPRFFATIVLDGSELRYNREFRGARKPTLIDLAVMLMDRQSKTEIAEIQRTYREF